jgi:hypothetical protein
MAQWKCALQPANWIDASLSKSDEHARLSKERCRNHLHRLNESRVVILRRVHAIRHRPCEHELARILLERGLRLCGRSAEPSVYAFALKNRRHAPLLGWTAVTGEIHGHALLLVLIIFAWTPPHFWALAVHRKDEYAKADIPMLPVTHGEHYTKVHILLYTIIMILVTLLPYITGMLNWLYLLGALVLGAGFLYWSLVLLLSKRPSAGMDTFKYSIVYLMTLFVVMLLDHYLLPAPVPYPVP